MNHITETGTGNGADANSPPATRANRYPDYVTTRDIGLTAAEVRERFPWATTYHGLNGRVCWRFEDLCGGDTP
jgi:hypothetical protein